MISTYKATVLGITARGTLDLDLDLGFDVRIVQRVRLAGIDVAGHTAVGKEAAEWLRTWLATKGPAFIATPHQKRKFGRYLATLSDTTVGYVYQATVARVVDGDTLDLLVSLGFGVRLVVRARLKGLNTAEKDTPEGKADIQWVTNWLAEHGPTFTVETRRKEKYGRYLATLTAADGRCLNSDLIDAGLAAPYDGTGPRPLPPLAQGGTAVIPTALTAPPRTAGR